MGKRGRRRAAERARRGPRFDEALTLVLDALWAGGWTPAMVVHVVGRDLSAAHGDRVAAAVIAQAEEARADGTALHPRWEAQVNVLAEERAADVVDDAVLAEAVLAEALLACLRVLPTVPPTIPPPGHPGAGADLGLTGLDERILSRVRALLAKAESTEFEAEAEALSAKAQELISRHAIDEVALHRHEAVGEPSVRHLLLDDPYLDAKAALLGTVAAANRCRAVHNPRFAWVTVFGYEADLDAVELLGASLLAQATAAMARLGPQRDASGRSRTRSFRRAFLYGFAGRVGQRLAAAAASQVDGEEHGDLLPVLAARDDRVEAAVSATFPRVQHKRTSVTNGGGYQAGRAAAERAAIDVPGGALR